VGFVIVYGEACRGMMSGPRLSPEPKVIGSSPIGRTNKDNNLAGEPKQAEMRGTAVVPHSVNFPEPPGKRVERDPAVPRALELERFRKPCLPADLVSTIRRHLR